MAVHVSYQTVRVNEMIMGGGGRLAEHEKFVYLIAMDQFMSIFP